MADEDLFVIKQGRTKPTFRANLYNGTQPATRVLVDLTTATSAKIYVKSRTTLVVNGATVTIDNQTTNLGGIYYAPQTSDTANPGTYQAEVVVTWGDGSTETFPGDGYFTWLVEPSLGT